jgi:hypothetical protein
MMKKCLSPGCNNPTTDGLKTCSAHFKYRRKGPRKAKPQPTKCLKPDCSNLTVPDIHNRPRKTCPSHLRWRGTKPVKFKRVGIKCKIEGCNELVTTIGSNKPREWCIKHFRRSLGGHIQAGVRNFPARKCILCGWEGPCDKHRMVMGKDGGVYIEGNVVILCPNCHRLLHRGIIDNGAIEPFKGE